MAFTTIYPLDIASPVSISRESYNDVGSNTFTLGSIPRYFTGASFELWDAKSGGTQLTLTTDYTLELSSSYYTGLASEAVYLGVKIVNATYQSGSIFATYDTIGSPTSADFYNTIQEAGSGLFRNAIINGNMEISQRGVSFPAIISGAHSLDRWEYAKTGAMVHTITQDTDVPNGLSQHSLKIDCTTIDASIAAGDFAALRYNMEGYDSFPFISQPVILSFWVKATKTGVYCISFMNDGFDRSYVSEYTVDTSDTWEYKTITLTVDDGLTGTWDFEEEAGIRISFMLASGSTFQTTANSWQTGTFFSTSNQVNACDDTANNFFISQVQFNKGSIALPFQLRHNEIELALCQRYYEILSAFSIFSSDITSGGVYGQTYLYKNSKRTDSPTITLTDEGVSGFSGGAPALNNGDKNGFNVIKTASGTQAAGFYIFGGSSDDEL